jgi:hypothetical protein
MKRLLLPIAILAVMGCKAPKPQVVVQRVEVPVAVPCPAPPALTRPTSHVQALPPNASPDQQAKAIVADLASWIGYAVQEESILTGYRKQSGPAK